MPESYQVMKAEYKESFGEGDRMRVYALMLDPNNGSPPREDIQLYVHKDARPPEQGQHLEGDISPDKQGRPTFRRAKPETPSASASGTYRAMDPDREASIIRQHSEDMALRDAQIRTMLDKEGFAKVFSCVWVKKVTDWYVADAKGENPEAHYFDFDKSGAENP